MNQNKMFNFIFHTFAKLNINDLVLLFMIVTLNDNFLLFFKWLTIITPTNDKHSQLKSTNISKRISINNKDSVNILWFMFHFFKYLLNK